MANEADTLFFSNLNAPKTIGGKASSQPKRTPISNEEMDAILVTNFMDFYELKHLYQELPVFRELSFTERFIFTSLFTLWNQKNEFLKICDNILFCF